MIKLKNNAELELMREAGKITAGALETARSLIKPGVMLQHIDTEIRHFIERHNCKPSFLGYSGFPASACISVNEEVIHGIPGERRLQEGDIVKVDVGAIYKGYNGDAARTFFCGKVSEQAEKLERVTRESFFEGIKFADSNHRIGDLSNAIEQYVISNGFSVVKSFVGHGVGKELHEDPEVPNFGKEGRGVRLMPGMTIAIEPMVNEKSWEVNQLSDGWTVVTKDGGLSAHFEHTVAVTDDGPVILTKA